MIEISNTEVVGFDHAIRGARNSWDSWDKSDSRYVNGAYVIGDADLDLLMRLAKAGSDAHCKYLRYIMVYFDINAPMYWWKEFDTYKVGTVRNSCSTMHRILARPIEKNDFSYDHLGDTLNYVNDGKTEASWQIDSMQSMNQIISKLNSLRDTYLSFKNTPEIKDKEIRDSFMKEIWYNVIQLLPSSYMQKSTIVLNYQVLRNIYPDRHCHKLDEWHDFCDWIKKLPYSQLITANYDAKK